MELLENIKHQLLYDPSSPLLFNTGLFMVLFLFFLLFYNLLSKLPRVKIIFVILFSLYFYYKSSASYCWILLGVCVSDYLLGLWMGASRRNWIKRVIVGINVIMNIGMLIYFKYFNLLIETISNFSSQRFDPLDIILPAGISFFTFRSISYIVDIYRGEIAPCKNFLHYTFFLTFFPPLLAGPVVRAKDMLPQIESNPVVTRRMVSVGFFLIMCGLVKKMVIADYLSGNFVDRVFDNPSLYSGFENLMAVYGFAIQLYCDFSGYSDMAIGLAFLLGFAFKENFNAPFKSQNPSEFWRRWHISLSTWLRDYLYIPLGGNRVKTRTRANFNLFNTMLIGGLWHGASWMYLLWGAWNGLLLILHKFFRRVFHLNVKTKVSWWRAGLNVFFTFNLLAVGFMFFRAESMTKVKEMMTAIVYNFHGEIAPQFLAGYPLVVAAIAAALVLHFLPKSWSAFSMNVFHSMKPFLQALVVAIVIFIVIQARSSDLVPFIYMKY